MKQSHWGLEDGFYRRFFFLFFFSQRGLGKKITEGLESGAMKRGPALVGKGLIPKPLWLDDFLRCYRTDKAGRNPHRAKEGCWNITVRWCRAVRAIFIVIFFILKDIKIWKGCTLKCYNMCTKCAVVRVQPCLRTVSCPPKTFQFKSRWIRSSTDLCHLVLSRHLLRAPLSLYY